MRYHNPAAEGMAAARAENVEIDRARRERSARAGNGGVIERFWVVTDPTPASEIVDILFECDAPSFIRQIKGGLSEENRPTFYADRASAEVDALARLAAVRGCAEER